MAHHRISSHPVLTPPARTPIAITWQGRRLEALQGESIAAALVANGVRVFGHHPSDGSPQGIFCANGRCAQCLVIADGKPVKACVEPVRPLMNVQASEGLPRLPPAAGVAWIHDIREMAADALIIGGGPAGLAAAIELGKLGVQALLVDDKSRLGGKLVLQTHRFFGSANAVHAGTRGIDIATRLEREVNSYPSIQVWCGSTALAVFSDHKIGVLKHGPDGRTEYVLVTPRALLVMTGARERFLTFRGNTLPGVFGAGAFQTLVNRDLVRPAERVLVVGGGNVGLITAYHALQAGISVVGVVEALPECGGYRVHKDKLARQGVPIHASHTILSANGTECVESATIARVDDRFHPIAGTERSFACDAVLVAAGLDPENDLYVKARELGMTAFVAGDAEEIAEASSAIFTGKIRGMEAARALGIEIGEIPPEWHRSVEILKSRPGKVGAERAEGEESGVSPVFHCIQEIPCDPCASVCPQGAIHIDPQDIRKLPVFLADEIGKECVGCEKCVTICPGQAITLVDYRKDPEHPFVTIPHELDREGLRPGVVVTVLDIDGAILGNVEVVAVHAGKAHDRTVAVKVRAPRQVARKIAGIRTREEHMAMPIEPWVEHLTDDAIVCRCERVTASALRTLIRQGYRDMNEIKAVTRAAMGACGAKTCGTLIRRLFEEEGIAEADVAQAPRRPLYMEVPLGVFAGIEVTEQTEGDHG
jgi:NADPH-dependent 2,4-dienoyl-CoA reductase/sulfur reductase-like enzyme/Fe-S-cluster-containing hydrogenase component 2